MESSHSIHISQSLVTPYMSFLWQPFIKVLNDHASGTAEEDGLWLVVLQATSRSLVADEGGRCKAMSIGSRLMNFTLISVLARRQVASDVTRHREATPRLHQNQHRIRPRYPCELSSSCHGANYGRYFIEDYQSRHSHAYTFRGYASASVCPDMCGSRLAN